MPPSAEGRSLHWITTEDGREIDVEAFEITDELVDRAAGLLHGHECGWKRAFADLPWFHQKVHRDVAREGFLEAVFCA